MADDEIRVPRRLLLDLLRVAAEARNPRDGLAAVSAVVAELVWPGPVPRVDPAGTSTATWQVPHSACSVEDVARRTGSSSRSVRRAAERGTLNGQLVDGRWRFTEQAVAQWKEIFLTETATARRKPVDPIAEDRAAVQALSVEFEELHARSDELLGHAEGLRIQVQVALATGDPLGAHRLSKEADQAAVDAAAARDRAREVRDERNPLAGFIALHDQRQATWQAERDRLEGVERTVRLDALHRDLAAEVERENEWRRTCPAAGPLPRHLRDVAKARGGSSVAGWQFHESCLPSLRRHVESTNMNGSKR